MGDYFLTVTSFPGFRLFCSCVGGQREYPDNSSLEVDGEEMTADLDRL